MIKNFYASSAHNWTVRFVVLCVINGFIAFTTNFSSVELIGTVEGPTHTWLNHVTYGHNQLDVSYYYSERQQFSNKPKALHYQYKNIEMQRGGYIAFGLDETEVIRQMRTYYIDEQCMLFFYDSRETRLDNVSLRCFIGSSIL